MINWIPTGDRKFRLVSVPTHLTFAFKEADWGRMVNLARHAPTVPVPSPCCIVLSGRLLRYRVLFFGTKTRAGCWVSMPCADRWVFTLSMKPVEVEIVAYFKRRQPRLNLSNLSIYLQLYPKAYLSPVNEVYRQFNSTPMQGPIKIKSFASMLNLNWYRK